MKFWETPGWRGELSALLAGCLLPLALSPHELWLMAIVSTTTFAILLNGQSGRRAFVRSIFYGLGLFGSGASWVYVSIHDFGYTAAPLAIILTTLFVSFLAVVFALPFYLYGRFISCSRAGFVFGFPALWVLGEWSRSWLFTGFPWLYVGYSHLDTWLSGWAPVSGVYSLSLFSILSGTIFCHCLYVLYARLRGDQQRWSALLFIGGCAVTVIGAWLSGAYLSTVRWTTPIAEDDRKKTVAIIQPNVPLELKWNPFYYPDILKQLDEASDQHWDKDIQVWPEAAIPSVYHQVGFFIEEVEEQANASQTNIFSGVLYDNEEPEAVYNSITGIGPAKGIYFKQKLVPFGEYVPFEDQLRGLINFFDLPNSVIRIGPYQAQALTGQHSDGQAFNVSAFICYEIVYPDFVAKSAGNATLLITISNDAWFGDSVGPFQHFEMARMRALENGKDLIRSTNTGISAIVNWRGEITALSQQFQQEILTGDVTLRQGSTPFSRWGSYPVLMSCLIILLVSIWLGGHRTRSPQRNR